MVSTHPENMLVKLDHFPQDSELPMVPLFEQISPMEK